MNQQLSSFRASGMRITALLFTVMILLSLKQCKTNDDQTHPMQAGHNMETNSKPFVRYWWFASMIEKKDVQYNLDWLKQQGFGGVEIAWVYPLSRIHQSEDIHYTPRQKWLGEEWREIVEFTACYADSIGLACDFTFGTLWPFGDSHVTYENASQVYGTNERQIITASWEYPDTGYVIDHLDPVKYLDYFERVLNSYPYPRTQQARSAFIDSWEVESKRLWTDRFDEKFQEQYNYDITPYMPILYEEGQEDVLYDYMKLISENVIGFYAKFDSVLNDRGLHSRGQCAGAPADILSAYATLDIPESEALLYEPSYSHIPASAALLSNKRVVSAETFTCLYGWPANHLREEQAADLKLLADALFANGVNHIIWHGRPHNPAGIDSISFYASVHVGRDGNLYPQLKELNAYLETVSSVMKRGVPYTDIAVYLPTEDNWRAGIMPLEKQYRWAWGYYEMRYISFPEELKGFQPAWINSDFLEHSDFKNGKLTCGQATFSALYVDVSFMDERALERIYELAREGLPVVLKQKPVQPGKNKSETYERNLKKLEELSVTDIRSIGHIRPIITGEDLPPFRVRKDADTLFVFLAHPLCDSIQFPMQYGGSFCSDTISKKISVSYFNKNLDFDLVFGPNSSLLYRIEEETNALLPFAYAPPVPLQKTDEKMERPWLMERNH